MQINFGGREIAHQARLLRPRAQREDDEPALAPPADDRGARGRLMTLETKDDRTLFFDMLPLTFRAESERDRRA